MVRMNSWPWSECRSWSSQNTFRVFYTCNFMYTGCHKNIQLATHFWIVNTISIKKCSITMFIIVFCILYICIAWGKGLLSVWLSTLCGRKATTRGCGFLWSRRSKYIDTPTDRQGQDLWPQLLFLLRRNYGSHLALFLCLNLNTVESVF